jgi:hypothetical protein
MRVIAIILLASLAMTALAAEANAVRNRKMLWDGFSGEWNVKRDVDPAAAAVGLLSRLTACRRSPCQWSVVC